MTTLKDYTDRLAALEKRSDTAHGKQPHGGYRGEIDISELADIAGEALSLAADLTGELKGCVNTIDILTTTEANAVARYLPFREETERLRTENAALVKRNRALEDAHDTMREAAEAVVAVGSGG